MAMSNEDRKPISVHMSLDAKTWDLFKKICNVEMGLPANRVVESLLEVILDQSKARPMMEKMIADAAKSQKMELSEDQLQTVVATAIKDWQKKLEEM